MPRRNHAYGSNLPFEKDLIRALRESAAEARAAVTESEGVALAIANSVDDEVMAENFQRALNLMVEANDERVEPRYPLPDEPGYYYNPVPPREEIVTADGLLGGIRFMLAPLKSIYPMNALQNAYSLAPTSARNDEFSFDRAVDGTFVFMNIHLKHESVALLQSESELAGACRFYQVFQLPQACEFPVPRAYMYNQWDGEDRRFVQFSFRVDDTAYERIMSTLHIVCVFIKASS